MIVMNFSAKQIIKSKMYKWIIDFGLDFCRRCHMQCIVANGLLQQGHSMSVNILFKGVIEQSNHNSINFESMITVNQNPVRL
jgi:hypothetical protein